MAVNGQIPRSSFALGLCVVLDNFVAVAIFYANGRSLQNTRTASFTGQGEGKAPLGRRRH